MSKPKNDKTNMNFPSLSREIPRVFITSEEDDSPTPTTLMESIHHEGRLLDGTKQSDEDAESTAPLLNSGSATPLDEEASMPLNLGTFLASSQKLKAEIQNEEINLSSLNSETKNSGDISTDIETDYPFIKWHWKFIRIVSSLITLFAILSCFGSSVFLIAHLPQKCDPQLNWYQGKIFYEVSSPAFGDFAGITLQLDYLKDYLNVDALRLNSVLEVNNNDFPEQFSANATTFNTNLGNIEQFQHLMENVEKRNMTAVIDVAVDTIIRDTTRLSELKMENFLKYWLHHGVHGFYLKGLTHFAQDLQIWKIIAKWKSLLDNYSSGFSKRRILIVSSDFLEEFARNFPLNIDDVQGQFDLIDHYLDTSRPTTLAMQIQQGFRWDKGVNSWIMWNVGSLKTKERLTYIFKNNNGCNPFVGSLMLAMGLPGSASILYSDEIDSLSGHNPKSINNTLEENVVSETNHCASALGILRNFRQLRKEAVPLYMNAILKFDKDILESRKLNYNLKIIGNSTIVIERFFPRRHRYLLVVNLGIENTTTRELSSTYFGGETLSSSTGNIKGYIKLEQLKLTPGEGVLLLLDK